MTTLKVVLLKPSKYAVDGYVERFKTGYMPNATLYHIAGLTPKYINSVRVITHTVDEYVWDELDYLNLLRPDPDADCITLLALVGVQSHQFHRALDLAAFAKNSGVNHCIIGGPHPMTCDTGQFQNLGISFSLAEAEVVWNKILEDAIQGELQPVYGADHRWAETIDGPIVEPPSQKDLVRYIVPLIGLYPVRGCPYNCNYCSIIKISGRQVRSAPIACTIESLRKAKKANIRFVAYVSDNFNKYPEATELMEEMIANDINIPFSCQCDSQIARQPEFVHLLGKAGCHEIFVGVESFNKDTLRQVKKFHNRPDSYQEIIQLCNEVEISSHFSNIIGFPDDTPTSIQDHLDVIKMLKPSLASFYILTPVPGTDQYENYRAKDLLVEKNLDRYDGTCLTWQHPTISSDEMSKMLFLCYIDFCNTALRAGYLSENNKAMTLAFRHFARQNMHPMSGGTGKIKLDQVDEYIELRKKFFGIELAPMPDNLQLSTADNLLNRKMDWRHS